MVGPVLVVSPHLDDAVLSLGGTIAAWAAAGTRVVIASVYTAGPRLETVAPSMRKFADYGVRCAEDDAATRVIGAEVRRLGMIERAFRSPFLTGWSFFTTPAERAGFATLGEVRAALEPLAQLEPRCIVVPLGIGNHVDHVEAMIAATEWAIGRWWRERLWFYEDFYALARAMRAKHFVARTKMFRYRQSPIRRARRLGVILKTIAARIGGPPVETFLDPSLRDARWTYEVSRIDEATQRAAIACYASQTRAFGGLVGIERALRAYHRWYGGEPLWRPSRSP